MPDDTTQALPRLSAEDIDLDALTQLVVDASKHPERYLSAEEIAEYERCQQSIIDARRHGERIAHEVWIG